MKIGEGLRLVEGSVQFWIGDWARFGEKNGYYADSKTYDEIEEITGYSHQAIKDMKYVAESIPSSRRRDDISFSHHREVASQSEDKQELFLSRAAEEKLSIRELREEIRKESTTEEPVAPLKIITTRAKVVNAVIEILGFIENITSSESLDFEKDVYENLLDSISTKLNKIKQG
jgi:hypothetical protein